jgi:hypothetical protein
MIKKEPSATDILKGIAGAFSKIEIKDRRVTRLNMSSDMFHRLLIDNKTTSCMSSRFDYHFAGCINPLSMARTDPLSAHFWENPQWNPTGLTPEEHPIANLWGSEVYLKEKFEAISDPIGSGPRWTIRPQIRANFDDTYTVMPPAHPAIIEPVEIKFDPLEYIRENLTINVKTRACPIPNITGPERVAIESLREMLSESEYRRYIKYGFILVKGHSGDIYQIFRNKSHTKVWKNGKLVKEVCVRLTDKKIPPTDNVIAFKIMVETSEKIFLEKGNVFNMEKVA